jgi:hypothetical protein
VTKDIAILFGVNTKQPATVGLTDPEHYPAGGLLGGVAKLAQRVAWILLTEQGAIPYAPQVGTQLLTDAKNGFWRTTGDVWMSFASAKLDLLRQLRALEQPDDPPQERIADVELVGLKLTGNGWSLTLQLSTPAQRDALVWELPVRRWQETE